MHRRTRELRDSKDSVRISSNVASMILSMNGVGKCTLSTGSFASSSFDLRFSFCVLVGSFEIRSYQAFRNDSSTVQSFFHRIYIFS